MTEETVNILILKYIRGICSPVEQDQLKQWLNVSEKNRKHFEHITLIERQLLQMDLELDPHTNEEWELLKDQMEETAPIPMRFSRLRYLSIAASVAVMITMAWLVSMWISRPADPVFALEHVTQKGEFEQIELPDGSLVRMNADTRITVDPDFNDTNRKITLEGEAFFDVTKNPKRPFKIYTANTTVEVLGTSFNVSSYAEATEVEVAVVEGKVAFQAMDAEQITLEAQQAATYDKEEQSMMSFPLDKDLSLDWMDGRMVFRDMPLEKVYTSLERRFAVQINDQSKQGHLPYNNTLEREDSLEGFLSRLCIASGLAFSKNGEVITITAN